MARARMLMANDPDGALTFANEAVTLDAKSAWAWWVRGNIFDALALRDKERAAALDPKFRAEDSADGEALTVYTCEGCGLQFTHPGDASEVPCPKCGA